jgi:hypothetical protein
VKDEITKLTNRLIDGSSIKGEPDEAVYRGTLSYMLGELTPFELDMVSKATDQGWRVTDILHDIKGMSEQDEFFVPRVVGRHKRQANVTDKPKQIMIAYLETVVMPTGEIICAGETVGYVKDLGKYLTDARPGA